MYEAILSVGVDIGTSTTQLIFSRLTMKNRAGGSAVPRIQIVSKEVVYQSRIYFTPLKSASEIDADAVVRLVREEYRAAGVSPEEVSTGAVIITGETARKQNAASVLKALSDLAGDFVVAAAGPDLESVLAARGAGVDGLSEKQRVPVANLDVGGGTSNIAVYERGALAGVCCLDIGGRLIQVGQGRITYIFPKIEALARAHGISLRVGGPADEGTLRKVCGLMAGQLAQALHLESQDGGHAGMYTNSGKPLPPDVRPGALSFTGGVADCVYEEGTGDVFRYGDIGVLLGQAIRAYPALAAVPLLRAAETIRATVVGAGMHTTEVSGSTIRYARGRLPVKNIPILKISEEEEASLEAFTASIRRQLPLYQTEGRAGPVAIAFHGGKRTGFQEIQALAAAVIAGAEELIDGDCPLILVVQADIGKVLGNAVSARLGPRKDVICIDGIRTFSGDYIDIGEPVADGQVVPVVIKTLIFNS